MHATIGGRERDEAWIQWFHLFLNASISYLSVNIQTPEKNDLESVSLGELSCCSSGKHILGYQDGLGSSSTEVEKFSSERRAFTTP